jgi:hypothetical protein
MLSCNGSIIFKVDLQLQFLLSSSSVDISTRVGFLMISLLHSYYPCISTCLVSMCSVITSPSLFFSVLPQVLFLYLGSLLSYPLLSFFPHLVFLPCTWSLPCPDWGFTWFYSVPPSKCRNTKMQYDFFLLYFLHFF